MNKRGNLRKRLVAFALGTMLLAGAGTSAAFADTPAGNIDATHKGKIIIHKYQNPDDGNHGNGTEQTLTGKTAISGVTFTIAKVNDIDLTSNEGWQKVKGLKIDTGGSVKSKDGSKTYGTTPISPALGATDAKGKAATGDLDLGVYLVTETEAPDNVVAKSAPFLVTVPFPNADQGWLYTVNVYPKNTVIKDDDKPVKTVEGADGIHFPGDAITWKIVQPIPALGTDDHFTTFDITDQLPAGVDQIDKSAVTVKVFQGETTTPVTGLEPTVTVANNLVTVSFADKLADLKNHVGDKIVIEIAATIKADINASLKNTSKSHIEINDVPAEATPSTPGGGTTGPTTTEFVSMTLNKVNKDTSAKPLNGATFKIYPVAADATAGNACPAKDREAKEKTLETGAAPTFGGDAVAGQAVLKVVPGKYCVKETAAPVGYDIDPAWGKGKVVDVVTGNGLTQQIINAKVNDGAGSLLPKLPLTGAAGLVLLSLAGIAIVAIAVGTGVVTIGRKKREQEA